MLSSTSQSEHFVDDISSDDETVGGKENGAAVGDIVTFAISNFVVGNENVGADVGDIVVGANVGATEGVVGADVGNVVVGANVGNTVVGAALGDAVTVVGSIV